MRYLAVVWAVAQKDLRIELRVRERVIAMAGFAALTVILMDYALDRTGMDVQSVSAGLLWLTIIFAGVLGLERGFKLEEDDAAFQGLLTSPVPIDAIYLGKVVANFVLIGLVTVLAMGAFGIIFGAPVFSRPVPLLLIFGFGMLGFTALGTFFSAISLRSTMGSTLLPILMFPLLVPMVVFGVTATSRIFAGRPIADVTGMVRLLAAFALIALFGGAALFRFVTEE